MQHHIGHGLVLRRTRHQESDLRLSIFLKEIGKILVLAKGGLKFSNRLKALQEPLTEAEFHVILAPHGVHSRLIGGKLLSSPHRLSQNWDRFAMASKCCEVVELLLPFRAPSPDVYVILRSTLRRLSDGSLPAQQWIHFNVRIFNTLGYGDLSRELLRLLQPQESRSFVGSLMDSDTEKPWERVSEASLNRCRSFIDARLESLLPWQLKSGALVEQ